MGSTVGSFAQPELNRIDAQFVGELVHRGLDGEHPHSLVR